MEVRKYPFAIAAEVTVAIPANAQILRIDEDSAGNPALWAIVDPNNANENRVFRVAATNDVVLAADSTQNGARYVDTFHEVAGDVWYHVFDKTMQIV